LNHQALLVVFKQNDTMKAILFSMLVLCLSSLATAQNNTAIVLHNIGQVQYMSSKNASAARIYPGMELSLNGKIRCLKGGSAKLLYKGQTFNVSSGRLQDISEVVKSASSGSQMGFTGRFWSFITESVQESESTEKLQKHHQRYMSKTSAAIKGYATKKQKADYALLLAGKLPAATVTFRWRTTPGVGAYQFLLADEKGKAVAALAVRDTMLTLDLEQLVLDYQGEYQWEVKRGQTEEPVIALPFTLMASNTTEMVRQKLSSEPAFQQASVEEQNLMMAYFLEQDQSFYSAALLYDKLLAQSPDNPLYRRLYATFLARMNMLAAAQTLLK
jgi:hypothetical protein